MMRSRVKICKLFGLILLCALTSSCGEFWGGITWDNQGLSILAVAYHSGGAVALFEINSSNGALSEIAGSPFLLPSSTHPRRPTYSAIFNGILFVGDDSSSNLNGLFINPLTVVGTLSSASPETMTAADPLDFSFTKNGKFIFSDYHSNNVGIYSINTSTGSLTLQGGLFPTNPTCTAPNRILLDGTQQYMYLSCNGTNNVVPYTISTTSGTITSTLAPFAVGTTPSDMVIDPIVGQYIYSISNAGNYLFTLQITGTGTLTQIGGPGYETANLSGGSEGIAIDPSGKFLYVSNANTNYVNAYLTDPVNGVDYVSTTNITGGTGTTGIVVDPSGNFVYVTNTTSGNITILQINRSTGNLTVINPAFQTSTMVGASPVYMATFNTP